MAQTVLVNTNTSILATLYMYMYTHILYVHITFSKVKNIQVRNLVHFCTCYVVCDGINRLNSRTIAEIYYYSTLNTLISKN